MVPIQFAVKSELRGAVGGTITTAAISFLVARSSSGRRYFWSARASQLSPPTPRRRGEPVSGLLGAFYVAASITLTPKLGEANIVAFILASQVLASIIVDQFGLLNLPVDPAPLAGLGGAALVIAGVFVVRAPDHHPWWTPEFTLPFSSWKGYIGVTLQATLGGAAKEKRSHGRYRNR